MSEAAASRLLSREREELDTIALSIREGRRIVAFLVCGVELRGEVVACLSQGSGRVVPSPVEVKDAAGMLELLTEAAESQSGEIRSLSVDPGVEENVRALNWHREKLRKGASLLIWIPDVEGLRVVRRLAPDAFSFRDILVAIEGEEAESVVSADAEQNVDVQLARAAYEAEISWLAKLRAAKMLADMVGMRDGPGAALGVLREALEAVPEAKSLDEVEALAVADAHHHACMILRFDERLVEARRHEMTARSILRGKKGPRVRDKRSELAYMSVSPLGASHREILIALANTTRDSGPSLSALEARASSSHVERGDTRPALALRQVLLRWFAPPLRSRPWVQTSLAEVAIRAGRLDEAEHLLKPQEPWSVNGLGNEQRILMLAEQRQLTGEIPSAQRLLAQVVKSGNARSSFQTRRMLHVLAVQLGSVHEGLAGLDALLCEAATARRDGALYLNASEYTQCAEAAHEAERLSPEDQAGALTALREAQEVAISISGHDPPWYHALFPVLIGRVLSLTPAHLSEAIDSTCGALDFCERVYTDATPMVARTLITHLVKATRFEEALSIIDQVTPQLVEERFLEELARVRALEIACQVHQKATTPEIDAALADQRAVFEEMDAPRITADTLLELALLLPPNSAHPDTLSLLEEAHEMFADMRIVAREARCLEAIGDVLVTRGDPQGATSRHRTAKELLERKGLLLRVPLLEKKLSRAASEE